MGKPRKHIPIRTCISCGAKRNKDDLIRLALDTGARLIKDHKGKMHGRGAYVCRVGSCHEQLARNRRLKRLFRTDSVITVSSE